jgi:S-disulfanyl-L-cysteine oxidoreductase SoxD
MSVAGAAQNGVPIWTGSYTAAQAERGRVVVENHCGECHGDDLSGGEAPALRGPLFMVNWETRTVEQLFHKIRDTMPSRDSTDVSLQQKLETVAFILQQNGFPAGTSELTDTAGLASLRIVPKEGVGAPRTGALVRAAGCLVESAPNRWALNGGTEPEVTTLDQVSEDDRKALAAAAGSQTIELMNVFPRPDAHKNRKVVVKGLFAKAPASVRINVTTLEPLGSDCSR